MIRVCYMFFVFSVEEFSRNFVKRFLVVSHVHGTGLNLSELNWTADTI